MCIIIYCHKNESKPKIIAEKQNAHVDIVDNDLFDDITKKLGVKL